MELIEQLRVTDTFKQWRDKINAILEQYEGVPATDLQTGILTFDTDSTQADSWEVNLPSTFKVDVTFEKNITVNGEIKGTSDDTKKLKTAVTINQTSFDGSSNITTSTWGESRNICITDSGTNTSEKVSVNGSQDITLKLPEKIKATLEGTADKAKQLDKRIYIDGIPFEGDKNLTHFCECSTEAATNSKLVTCDGFTLEKGACLVIKFQHGNTSDSPKLNVNNTGDKSLYQAGKPLEASAIVDGTVLSVVYDGSNYVVWTGVNNRVLQENLKNTTTNESTKYPLLLSSISDSSTNNTTDKSFFSQDLTYNPSTKTIEHNGTVSVLDSADYAEMFPSNETTEAGDIIALDTTSHQERYIKALYSSKLIVGIHSDNYGYIVGEKEGIPVALSGRVLVKFIGKSELGEAVVPHETIKGVGRLYKNGDDKDKIIGYIVEDEKNTEEQRKVKVFIKH